MWCRGSRPPSGRAPSLAGSCRCRLGTARPPCCTWPCLREGAGRRVRGGTLGAAPGAVAGGLRLWRAPARPSPSPGALPRPAPPRPAPPRPAPPRPRPPQPTRQLEADDRRVPLLRCASVAQPQRRAELPGRQPHGRAVECESHLGALGPREAARRRVRDGKGAHGARTGAEAARAPATARARGRDGDAELGGPAAGRGRDLELRVGEGVAGAALRARCGLGAEGSRGVCVCVGGGCSVEGAAAAWAPARPRGLARLTPPAAACAAACVAAPAVPACPRRPRRPPRAPNPWRPTCGQRADRGEQGREQGGGAGAARAAGARAAGRRGAAGRHRCLQWDLVGVLDGVEWSVWPLGPVWRLRRGFSGGTSLQAPVTRPAGARKATPKVARLLFAPALGSSTAGLGSHA
jgi:hypothetical protein